MSDPRPIGVFDSGVGGLTVLREIVRRTPAESTIYLGDNARAPYGVRPDDEVLAFSTQSLDALAERDVKAHRRRLQHLDGGRASAPSGGATTCRSSASSGPGASAAALATRNRRVGVIATPATIRSHAYFSAIKDENPAVEVYEHATPTLVPLVEAGELSGPAAEAAVAEALAPLLGDRDRGRRVHLPAAARRRDRHAAARLHALPVAAAAHRRRRRRRVAIVDSATATASALAELLGINGLEAAPTAAAAARTCQLTTGDPARSTPSPAGCSGRRSPTSSRSISRSRRAMTGPATRARTAGPAVARRSRLAGRASSSGPRSAPPRPSPVAAPSEPRDAGLVDWPEVERIAIGRLREARRARSTPAELRAAEPAYAEAMARIVPALSAALGTPLPGVVSGRASSIGPAGCAPTRARSRR